LTGATNAVHERVGRRNSINHGRSTDPASCGAVLPSCTAPTVPGPVRAGTRLVSWPPTHQMASRRASRQRYYFEDRSGGGGGGARQLVWKSGRDSAAGTHLSASWCNHNVSGSVALEPGRTASSITRGRARARREGSHTSLTHTLAAAAVTSLTPTCSARAANQYRLEIYRRTSQEPRRPKVDVLRSIVASHTLQTCITRDSVVASIFNTDSMAPVCDYSVLRGLRPN